MCDKDVRAGVVTSSFRAIPGARPIFCLLFSEINGSGTDMAARSLTGEGPFGTSTESYAKKSMPPSTHPVWCVLAVLIISWSCLASIFIRWGIFGGVHETRISSQNPKGDILFKGAHTRVHPIPSDFEHASIGFNKICPKNLFLFLAVPLPCVRNADPMAPKIDRHA